MGKNNIRDITQKIVEAIDTGGFSIIKKQKGEQQRELKQVATGEAIQQLQGVINILKGVQQGEVKQIVIGESQQRDATKGSLNRKGVKK